MPKPAKPLSIVKPWSFEPESIWDTKREENWRERGGLKSPDVAAEVRDLIKTGTRGDLLGLCESTYFGGYYKWYSADPAEFIGRIEKEYGKVPVEWDLLLDTLWGQGEQIFLQAKGIGRSLKKLARTVGGDRKEVTLLSSELGKFKAGHTLQGFFLPYVRDLNGRRAYKALEGIDGQTIFRRLEKAKWPVQESRDFIEEAWIHYRAKRGFHAEILLVNSFSRPEWISQKIRDEFAGWVGETAKEEHGLRGLGNLVRAWPVSGPKEAEKIYTLVKQAPDVVSLFAENKGLPLGLMKQMIKEVPAPGVRLAAAKRTDCLNDPTIRSILLDGRNKVIWAALLRTTKDPGEASRLAGYLGIQDPKALQKVLGSDVLGIKVSVPNEVLLGMFKSQNREVRLGAARILPKIERSQDPVGTLPAQAKPIRRKKVKR